MFPVLDIAVIIDIDEKLRPMHLAESSLGRTHENSRWQLDEIIVSSKLRMVLPSSRILISTLANTALRIILLRLLT